MKSTNAACFLILCLLLAGVALAAADGAPAQDATGAGAGEAVQIVTGHACKQTGYTSTTTGIVEEFGKPGPEAPEEIQQLAFLVGQWELDAWFTRQDGSRKHSTATLTARYVLDGMGLETTERYPSEGEGPDFVGKTTYVFNPRLGAWTGVGINTLGNGKNYKVSVEDGKLILIQSGMLFGGRPGINRITHFDVTETGFKSIHEHSPDDGKTWQDSAFGYTARRIK